MDKEMMKEKKSEMKGKHMAEVLRVREMPDVEEEESMDLESKVEKVMELEGEEKNQAIDDLIAILDGMRDEDGE